MKIYSFLIASFALFTSVAAYAQQAAPQKKIEINVTASFEPANAVGLIISTQGARQQPSAEFKRINPTSLVVQVPYRDSELPRDAMASAIVFSKDGQMAFGSVRPILTQDPRESFLDIPECPPEKVNESALQGNLSVLEALVQKRNQRRGIAQVKVAQIMSDKFLERLRRLERGFGFNYSKELTPDLPPAELTDRLARILEVVQSVKANNPQAGASSSTAQSSR